MRIIRQVVLVIKLHLLIDIPYESFLHPEDLSGNTRGECAAVEVHTIRVDLVLILDGGDLMLEDGGLASW